MEPQQLQEFAERVVAGAGGTGIGPIGNFFTSDAFLDLFADVDVSELDMERLGELLGAMDTEGTLATAIQQNLVGFSPAALIQPFRALIRQGASPEQIRQTFNQAVQTGAFFNVPGSTWLRDLNRLGPVLQRVSRQPGIAGQFARSFLSALADSTLMIAKLTGYREPGSAQSWTFRGAGQSMRANPMRMATAGAAGLGIYFKEVISEYTSYLKSYAPFAWFGFKTPEDAEKAGESVTADQMRDAERLNNMIREQLDMIIKSVHSKPNNLRTLDTAENELLAKLEAMRGIDKRHHAGLMAGEISSSINKALYKQMQDLIKNEVPLNEWSDGYMITSLGHLPAGYNMVMY